MIQKHIQNNSLHLHKCEQLALEINKIFPLSQNVLDAISKTQREIFVPRGFKHHAYKLDALPLSANQWISSPMTVAKMSEALNAKGADSVLEIGCGSGYQAAVLSKMFRRVFTIERIEPLLNEAKECFKTLNITNIHTRFDDGNRGWKSYAPYDRILFSASAPEPPVHLFDQLKDSGILVAPIDENGKQVITRFIKNGMKIKVERLEECLFVPIKDGVQR
ncbi:MAG TPA: protein-L-isoaspartate(D-aspartate) O-methyltransferase [Campylobacterales bacterium]|nr:protein-L-isoaspartate(D-aspartate) O-methyltransferase [Campylobacterales bacterium]